MTPVDWDELCDLPGERGRGFESAVADLAKDTTSDGAPAHRAIDRPGLQTYLRARFPHASDLTVHSVNAIPGGHSKETIQFEIEPHPDWPAAMVIRMDAGRYGTSVTQEFPLLVALAREHIPVPTPLWVETDASVFGGAFMVTRRMPGAPPGTLWDVSGVSAATGAELAAALGRLHALPLRSVGIDGSATAQPFVQAMLASSEERWRQGMPIASVAMEAAYGWMRESRDASTSAPAWYTATPVCRMCSSRTDRCSVFSTGNSRTRATPPKTWRTADPRSRR